MRTKTLLSLLILTGSTAAIANMAPVQEEPLQNSMANEGIPAPAEAPAPEPAPAPTDDGTDAASDSNETSPEPN